MLLRNSAEVSPEFIRGSITDLQGNQTRKSFPIKVVPLMPSAEIVSIPDKNLAAAVQGEIGRSITTHTMLNFEFLDARNQHITDLTGLEHAHNLTALILNGEDIDEDTYVNSNAIRDISALSGLIRLETLLLGDNAISDISGLSGLTQLQSLSLDSNAISDISGLSGLTQLTELYIPDNAVSDISGLSGLTQLQVLWMTSNAISDISGLSSLTQLTRLYISDNAVSDISGLSGLTQLKWLFIESNPLSYTSVKTHIPALQAKGVQVWFDDVAHSALVKISGDAQEGTAGEMLSTPFVVEVQDERGKPMRGVSITFAVLSGSGRLRATTTTTHSNGRAQAILTLGQRPGRNTVRATAEGIPSFAIFNATGTEATAQLITDVNGDGVVNIQDLVLVSSRFGQMGQNRADVNGDGAINIQDLVLVAGELGTEAAAPTAWHHTSAGIPARATVAQWLTQAHRFSFTDARSQRGVLLLERLLATLTPKETVLLTNYPNPFNPETWIPYQLAKATDVTVRIYAADGSVVRTLALGHQDAGVYRNRSQAAYWDGTNDLGESVASGLYFYTLTAGEFSATRRMLILK